MYLYVNLFFPQCKGLFFYTAMIWETGQLVAVLNIELNVLTSSSQFGLCAIGSSRVTFNWFICVLNVLNMIYLADVQPAAVTGETAQQRTERDFWCGGCFDLNPTNSIDRRRHADVPCSIFYTAPSVLDPACVLFYYTNVFRWILHTGIWLWKRGGSVKIIKCK